MKFLKNSLPLLFIVIRPQHLLPPNFGQSPNQVLNAFARTPAPPAIVQQPLGLTIQPQVTTTYSAVPVAGGAPVTVTGTLVPLPQPVNFFRYVPNNDGNNKSQTRKTKTSTSATAQRSSQQPSSPAERNSDGSNEGGEKVFVDIQDLYPTKSGSRKSKKSRNGSRESRRNSSSRPSKSSESSGLSSGEAENRSDMEIAIEGLMKELLKSASNVNPAKQKKAQKLTTKQRAQSTRKKAVSASRTRQSSDDEDILNRSETRSPVSGGYSDNSQGSPSLRQSSVQSNSQVASRVRTSNKNPGPSGVPAPVRVKVATEELSEEEDDISDEDLLDNGVQEQLQSVPKAVSQSASRTRTTPGLTNSEEVARTQAESPTFGQRETPRRSRVRQNGQVVTREETRVQVRLRDGPERERTREAAPVSGQSRRPNNEPANDEDYYDDYSEEEDNNGPSVFIEQTSRTVPQPPQNNLPNVVTQTEEVNDRTEETEEATERPRTSGRNRSSAERASRTRSESEERRSRNRVNSEVNRGAEDDTEVRGYSQSAGQSGGYSQPANQPQGASKSEGRPGGYSASRPRESSQDVEDQPGGYSQSAGQPRGSSQSEDRPGGYSQSAGRQRESTQPERQGSRSQYADRQRESEQPDERQSSRAQSAGRQRESSLPSEGPGGYSKSAGRGRKSSRRKSKSRTTTERPTTTTTSTTTTTTTTTTPAPPTSSSESVEQRASQSPASTSPATVEFPAAGYTSVQYEQQARPYVTNIIPALQAPNLALQQQQTAQVVHQPLPQAGYATNQIATIPLISYTYQHAAVPVAAPPVHYSSPPQQSFQVGQPPQQSYQVSQSPQQSYQVSQAPQQSYQVSQSPQQSYQVSQSPQQSYQVSQSPQQSVQLSQPAQQQSVQYGGPRQFSADAPTGYITAPPPPQPQASAEQTPQSSGQSSEGPIVPGGIPPRITQEITGVAGNVEYRLTPSVRFEVDGSDRVYPSRDDEPPRTITNMVPVPPELNQLSLSPTLQTAAPQPPQPIKFSYSTIQANNRQQYAAMLNKLTPAARNALSQFLTTRQQASQSAWRPLNFQQSGGDDATLPLRDTLSLVAHFATSQATRMNTIRSGGRTLQFSVSPSQVHNGGTHTVIPSGSAVTQGHPNSLSRAPTLLKAAPKNRYITTLVPHSDAGSDVKTSFNVAYPASNTGATSAYSTIHTSENDVKEGLFRTIANIIKSNH